MNKRGLGDGITIGSFILMFVAIIVAVSLLTGGITGNVGILTTKSVITNQTITFPSNITSVTLRGQAVDSVVVKNASGFTIPSGNYTISNYVVSNGQLISTITGVGLLFSGNATNISYVSEPYGYDTNGGGRVIANLIIIFAALAIAVVALVPVLRNGVIDLVN
jgi:hypothetical protein